MTTELRTNFQAFVEDLGFMRDFPLLHRAAAIAHPAYAGHIGWLGAASEVWHNYCQIVRFPYEEPFVGVEEGSTRHGFSVRKEEQLVGFGETPRRIG